MNDLSILLAIPLLGLIFYLVTNAQQLSLKYRNSHPYIVYFFFLIGTILLQGGTAPEPIVRMKKIDKIVFWAVMGILAVALIYWFYKSSAS